MTMRKRVVTMHNGKIISDEKEGGYHEASNDLVYPETGIQET